MARIHAELNTNILLTRNFPIDSGARKWSHSLMISLHCLWAKSNIRMWRAWFCFCIDFVRSHALCGCRTIVFWREWGDLIKIGLPRSRGGKVLDVDGQERWSRKIDNFHERHVCIVPNWAITIVWFKICWVFLRYP